ncbi:MAG: outer membrane beta-barrel protein [Holophagales bacterium]|jgi:hypothetical protein|nr:outer membrane beta-barrel protein [Holophagales bacterium]
MKITTTILCASLAILAAAPAFAQDKYSFGLLGSSMMSSNDELKKLTGVGFGLGGFVERSFDDGIACRFRAEYTILGDKEQTVRDELGSIKWSHSSKMQGAMIDFILRLGSRFFYFGSIGYMSLDIDSNLVDALVALPRQSMGYMSLGIDNNNANIGGELLKRHLDFDGFTFGIGWRYQFTKHIGAETKIQIILSKGMLKHYPNFQDLSLVYRF